MTALPVPDRDGEPQGGATPDARACFQRHRYALVVGHPGHALWQHGWPDLVRPLVIVLTDGSVFEALRRRADGEAA